MIANRFYTVIALTISGFALAACNSKPPVSPPPFQISAVDKMIAESVQTAAKAQDDLARVQIARTKPAPMPLDETGLPAALKMPITVNWSGPAPEAARKVAQMIGYSFSVTGNEPAIKPVVNISLKDVSAAKALENIGLQSFPYGEVTVDPNVKRVEFRYLQAQYQPKNVSGSSPRFGK